MKAESSNGEPESDSDPDALLEALGIGDDSEEEEEESEIAGAQPDTPGAFWTEEDEDDDIIANLPGVEVNNHTEKQDHVAPPTESQTILDELGLENSNDGSQQDVADTSGAFWTEKDDDDDIIPGAEVCNHAENRDHDAPSTEFQNILDELGLESEDEEELDDAVHGESPLIHAAKRKPSVSFTDFDKASHCYNQDEIEEGVEDGMINVGKVKDRHTFGSTSTSAANTSLAPLPRIVEKDIDQSSAHANRISSDGRDNLFENSPRNSLAHQNNSLARDGNSLASKSVEVSVLCESNDIVLLRESDDAALLRRVSDYLSTEQEEPGQNDEASKLLQDIGDAADHHTTAIGDLEDLGDMEALARMAMGRSTLSLKDLSLQNLEPLCLQAVTGLSTLRLAGNEFRDTKALACTLDSLKSLTDLDLSRCQLKELPVLQHLRHLQRFNASQNFLNSSHGILYCTELRHVNFSHNQLKRIEQLETLGHLEELDVSHNRLGPTVLAAMRTVAACAQLRVLQVVGNPFSSQRAHRVQITDLFPTLELIDGQRVQTLKISKKVTATRAKASLHSAERSSRGRVGILDQSAAVAETSISYGILAQGSPKRRPCQAKPARYHDPTESYTAHKTATAVSSRKHVESHTPTRRVTAQHAETPPNRNPKSTHRSAKPVVGNLNKKRQSSPGKKKASTSPDRKPSGSPNKNISSSPSKPWVVASCIVSPSLDTRVHEVHGRRVRLRSPFTRKHAVTSSLSSSAFHEELKKIDEADAAIENAIADAEMDSVLGEESGISKAMAGADRSDLQVSLCDLLEEKRRLLDKVRTQLSSVAGNSLSLPMIPMLPTDDTLSMVRKDSLVLGNESAVDIVAGTDDLRSLLASLRDGIERKRCLLEQLQHV